MGIVSYHVILQSEAQLQRQPDHQSRARRSEGFALRMRKQDDPEIVFPGLKTDGSQVANFRLREHTLEIRESSTLGRGQGLSHHRQIMDGKDDAPAVSQSEEVLPHPL